MYFKLLTGVFLLVLAGCAMGRLWSREPSYELYGTQICEVGDGITVSGFVVRDESLLYAGSSPVFTVSEGQWIGGGQALAATAGGTLTVPRGGYFSHVADGYESLLTPEYILNCKEEDLRSLRPEPVSSGAAGRLIRGQGWYFAVPGDFPSIEPGTRVTLVMEGEEYEATVLRSQEVLVLECKSYLYRITALREQRVRIRLSSDSAIPLPGRAIYYEEGESCVYVLEGTRARSRAVTIVRVQEDTVWVSPEDIPQGAQVILTEKEITDGMILK